jgi:hypothetical protein
MIIGIALPFEVWIMADVILLALFVGIAALTWALLLLCDRLMRVPR